MKQQNAKHSLWGTILKIFIFICLLGGVFFVVYLILKHFDLWDKINSVDKLRTVVETGGAYSVLIFMLLQFLQTTILQLPSVLVTMTGVLIFSKFKAFIYSYIAIMLGSLFNFWLGRKAGKRFLNWIVGEQSINKWIDIMSEGKYVFFLMMLFPMFPDDILCLVAGLTNMSFSFFLVTNIVCRAIGIGGTVLFGSGAIIPFTGWGIIIWILIAVGMSLLFYFSVKYQKQIDKWLVDVKNKINIKRK